MPQRKALKSEQGLSVALFLSFIAMVVNIVAAFHKSWAGRSGEFLRVGLVRIQGVGLGGLDNTDTDRLNFRRLVLLTAVGKPYLATQSSLKDSYK